MRGKTSVTPRSFFLSRLKVLLAGCSDASLLEHGSALRAEMSSLRSPDVTDTELDQFDQVLRHAAHVSLGRHLVADSYDRMSEFWDQVRLQESGQSDGTYWDSYEHGRRRQLEQHLADAYGSPAALLVNSGMSAIYCAVRALGEQLDGILAHTHAYFETSQLYELLQRDMLIERHDLNSAETVVRRMCGSSRSLLLVAESATNAPQTYIVPINDAAVTGKMVLLDNSVLSHGLCYRALRAEFPSARIVVLESGSKYLCSMASVGVVYGQRDDVDAIRLWARRIGQQLQAPAFAHLHDADITLAATRVHIHARAAAAFADALDPTLWRVRMIGQRPAQDGLRRLVHVHGPGALVFLEPVHRADLDALVDKWAALSRTTPRRVRLQAGFGWSWTSSRAYSGSKLNQPDAPHYIRVSVGLLTEQAAVEQAILLNSAAAEMHTHVAPA